MSNEFPSKISPIRQIPASEELLHFRISASSVSAFQRFSVSAFQLYQNAPFFPATSFSPASGPVTGSFMTNGQAFNHYLKIHRAVLS